MGIKRGYKTKFQGFLLFFIRVCGPVLQPSFQGDSKSTPRARFQGGHALYRLPPYRRSIDRGRLPGPAEVPHAANRRVLHGILTRILQSVSSDELVVSRAAAGPLALQYEAHHYKLQVSPLGFPSLSQGKRRKRKRVS